MYQLVFRGECAPGTDEQAARDNARALFKASLDQVERMFSGQRVVIRNKLDDAQAAKYQAVLRKHGMIAHIEPMPGTPTAEPARPTAATAPESTPEPTRPEPARAESSSAPTEARPAGSGVAVEPGDRLPVAGEKVDSILAGSSLSVGAIHDRLSEHHEVEAPMFEHLDEWTLAPAGSTLVEHQDEVPPAVPDISHLSLADNPDDRK